MTSIRPRRHAIESGGVPVIVVEPDGGARNDAPIVLAWHLMDPPRTESALAAAVPLDGLDAWRVYIGLPMCGSRMPVGGLDAVMQLGYQDAVMNMFGPVADQAADEAADVLADLRKRFDIGEVPIGALGGSIGATVALLTVAEGRLPIETAVLFSPMLRLRSVVQANERRFDVTYTWSDRSNEVADRLDFVARAGDLVEHGNPSIVLVVGGDDDETGFVAPANELRDARADQNVELLTVAGMAHAIADEPGLEPAPQTASAARVDALAVDWFRGHLTA